MTTPSLELGSCSLNWFLLLPGFSKFKKSNIFEGKKELVQNVESKIEVSDNGKPMETPFRVSKNQNSTVVTLQ